MLWLYRLLFVPALLLASLYRGSDEILALAGDPAPRAVPASFTEPAVSSRSAAGS